MVCTDLAEVRDERRAVLNVAMNLLVLYNVGNVLTS
jgi:hypothetical protein